MQLYLYGLGVWILFMLLAIINAGIREKLYKPKVGELRAHQISSIIFIILIFVVSYAFLKRVDATSMQSLLLGIIWFLLTIGFEFLFGHYIIKHPWSKLLADYNILKGRLWGLVLICILIAPWVLS